MKLEELLLEMKDTSELMVDLAYSALLYDSQEIAEEVLMMEEMIDDWNEEIQRKAIESVRDGESVDRALVLVRLSNSIENIADGAMQIADVVLRDIEPHPLIRTFLNESDVTIMRTVIGPKSPLAGKTLGDLRLATETGMWVIAIKRGRKWIYGPDEKTAVQVKDTIFARGPVDGREKLKRLASGAR